MKLHHYGYITDSIENTVKSFADLGYTAGEVYNDDVQKCQICLLSGGNTDIELVKPYEQNLSMQKMMKKRGVYPYHRCYEVDDIEAIYNDLTAKEGWLPLFEPVPAVALGNRLITYFVNADIGFVEFVNSSIKPNN